MPRSLSEIDSVGWLGLECQARRCRNVQIALLFGAPLRLNPAMGSVAQNSSRQLLAHVQIQSLCVENCSLTQAYVCSSNGHVKISSPLTLMPRWLFPLCICLAMVWSRTAPASQFSYDGSLRITDEVHRMQSAVVRQIHYDYDAAGNRTAMTANGEAAISSLIEGDRLIGVDMPGTARDQSFSYDRGGRLTGLTRAGSRWNMAYNVADQVIDVRTAAGASIQSATYDAMGRRVAVVTPSLGVRRFAMAPALSTSLETPYLATDANNVVQAAYAYGPTGPICQIAANGEAHYYLEDGIGSIIAQSNRNGVITDQFAFDAFGNPLESIGISVRASEAAGGDWSWKGMWKDAATGMYHVRARDYDPVTGRFVSRDPYEGDRRIPESLSPYAFANGNPLVFSDPSGSFTIVEMTTGIQMQGTIRQAVTSFAQNYGKDQARDMITDAVSDWLSKSFLSYVPGGAYLQSLINLAGTVPGNTAARAGGLFENDFLIGADQTTRPTEMNDGGIDMYLGPGINEKGQPIDDGVTLSAFWGAGTANLSSDKGVRRPDFVISGVKPSETTESSQAYIIGELKLSASALLNTYKKDDGQLRAILNYAASRVYPKVALFIVAGFKTPGTRAAKRTDQSIIASIRALLNKKSIKVDGVIPILIAP